MIGRMAPRKTPKPTKKPSADRLVNIACTLSRAEAAAFDATLGDLHRSQLLRRLILAHVGAAR